LKSSGISSATPSNPPHVATPRRSFALSGRSVALDPRTHAVRGDLADVRLADRVFAPHYAAPMIVKLAAAVPLRAEADAQSDVIAHLPASEVFEVFELAGKSAWGIACSIGLVGYIDASAIAGRAK
jgi:hypothetical protein